MLDRTTPPPCRPIERPDLPWPATHQLKAGMPLFVLNAGRLPILKLELVCDAGTWYEPHHGVAYCTAKMLLEGTQHKSAQAIAHHTERHGAHLQAKVQPDTCTFTLTTLSKHLQPMLALLAELLLAPAFAAQRLAHIKHLKGQQLKLQAAQNSHVAHQQLKAALFGSTHPYGRQLTVAALDAVTPAHLQQYYQHHLLANCRLFVSGQVREQDLQHIQQHLQALPRQVAPQQTAPMPTHPPTQVQLPKAASLQAALSLGQVLPAKSHPDYLPLLFVNTLLGGYFGSRLMRTIREVKGYTYGIFSKIVALKHTSYLCIATEVKQGLADATYEEIVQAIKTLQTVPVPPTELQALQHYLAGTLLAPSSDPFSLMERYKKAHLHGLDQAHYAQWHDTIVHTQPAQIMALANQYLSAKRLSQVIVG